MARTVSQILAKQNKMILQKLKTQKKMGKTMSNNEWKPFVFFDDYVKATPDGFSCDYREVTHKIPEYHTMIDPRTNEERKGIFIPAGDIQIECWFNPVDLTSPHYQDWHSDNMRVIIKEVDSYNRAYCDNQKKKNYKEKKT